uniref:Laminin subunit alpha 5 n=1 Tax=Amphiprion ocellaris TaxID=80972 RepID=A0AAQ6AFP7_AMPOC
MASGPESLGAALLLLLLTCCRRSSAQELPTNGVNGYSLHPPYFNLAEGTKITATATCGEEDTGRTVHDLYCKLVGGPVSGDPSQTIQGQYCDICSQGDSDRAHPITNAIDGTERWWQSPPLSRSTEYNEVNVTLDLGQLFHVAYVLIKFANSPRPDLWVLERSIDSGLTYQPWQYFASSKRDCIERFGQSTIERINHDDDVICTTEYSRIVPLENGEIVVSLVNGRPGAMNFSYSPVLREFTKATNIRLRFLRTNTLLGHLMGKALRDPTVTRRYYYSIKDISIGGRCVCNGHAEAYILNPKKMCDCQHNTCGVSCDQCCPGYNQLPWKPATTYSANECEPCNCHRHTFDCYYDPDVDQKRGSLDVHGHHRGGGVCLNCQHHTTGVNCERCIPTYYRSADHPIDSPLACSPCDCQSEFTDGTCEDVTGRCFCKPNYTGENCDSCASGFINFPECYREFYTVGSLPEGCDASGRCLCKPEFQGPRCEQCRSGFHSYPDCQACQCSPEGSRYSSCDQVTGQCGCLPGVVGLRCDSCAHGSYGFPNCQGKGPACDKCKPLYWNLSPDSPDGCSNCECNIAGTLSGVAECAQETGQCHCKPNACSGTCSTCKDGFYNLQEKNYFGCQGCQCDIGGSAGQSCAERNGQCRCRPNVEGPKCNLPRADHYFPDLHHLKFEIEEGTMLDGRPVRFGYNPLEFPDFSWRGYAQMSPIQSKVLVSVSVSSPDLFHVVLRYANWGGSDVRGRVSVIEDSSEQSKQIVFAPSVEPTFVNVPQNNFVEPFVLNPGTWTVVIEAEGILLDYLVLLPSAYYEAPILQIKVTEPCTYSSVVVAAALRNLVVTSLLSPPFHLLFYTQNAAVYSSRVHTLGRYVFILHYHQPLHPTYAVQVYINGGRIWQGQANASFCPHAYGCRNVLVSENQIILDVTDHEVFLTVQIPAGKTLWLDYVLVVPEASYSSSYLNEEPLDKSYDFISNCGQNSFYINPSSASPFCLSSAVSLSAFFNNGAMPCACHEVGAESDTCEQFGGQCHCRPNVIGRDCSMCATGYWGFPNCRPCNCGTRLCEPVTGDCICPPRTLQPECTQCEPQTFGCHPVVGCEICNCSRPGVVSPDVTCDTQTGQCRCKNNIVGRQCDRCAPGFYGYPNCRPCDCNEAGTEEEVCDSFTGQCLCKENVQGSRCDQCRVGTFHLDPTNPKGCTSCFCFGATDRCRSSDKRRTEIMNMEGWVLLGADRQEVPVTVYPGQDLVEADLSDVPDVYQDLHWHAPRTYLGDKVSSYGGYLRYRLHTQTMRGDVLSLPAEASRPDIILKVQDTLTKSHPHAGVFVGTHTGNSVSREELMMVLVGLESLQIRALHSQSAHSVSLRGAVLEGAEILPTGRHANNVEICMCPANYLGDSCQKCAPGYYRDTIGLFLGKCVPCNCNGHSDHCLDGSGICVSCQHNTAGDHCERCQGGFLGNNSLDGQAVSCSSCPCPLRAPSNKSCDCRGGRCDPRTGECRCPDGMTGKQCDTCSQRYSVPMENQHLLCRNKLKCVCVCFLNAACDSCVIVLLEDLDKMNDDFRSVAGQLSSLNASSMAWAQLNNLNKNRADICHLNQCYFTISTNLSYTLCYCLIPLTLHTNSVMHFLQYCCFIADIMLMANRSLLNKTEAEQDDEEKETKLREVQAMLREMRYRSCVGQKKMADKEKTEAEKLLDRVNKELAGRHGENSDLVKAIRDHLSRFHSQMMDLRDALNEAVNNTARAAEINNVNEKMLENLVAKQKEFFLFNTVLQEYERLAAQLDGARTPLAKKVQNFAWVDSKIPLVERAEKHAEMLNALEIDEAKRAANLANTTATQVNDALRPIKEQLDQWQKAYGDANATNDDINNALMDANNTVNKLGEAIPTLMKKLDELQNHSAQMPNISENINRIRQLIQQARNAASKVSVPVKFNGSSGVQVRTPSNLADLAAYTSLKFYITLPETARARRQNSATKQFVLYLGNKDVSIPTHESAPHAVFTAYLIVCLCECRILQYGQMSMSSEASEGDQRVTKASVEAKGDQGLLNLLTDDTVFYVGGYPSTFKPPSALALPNFKGCIELDTLNEEVLSLYNFEKIFQLNTTEEKPCGSIFFLLKIQQIPHFFFICRNTKVHPQQCCAVWFCEEIRDFNVNRCSSKCSQSSVTVMKRSSIILCLANTDPGVLWLQVGECQALLRAGHVVVSVGSSVIKTQKTYNDDNSHYVTIYNNVNGLEKHKNITELCWSNSLHSWYIHSTFVLLSSLPEQIQTNNNIVLLPHFSMTVRINSSDGLVLYAAGGQRGEAVTSLSISHGHLLLLLDGGKRKVSVRSRKKYNDDRWHTVRSHREREKISLIVDGISAQSKRMPGGDRTRLTGPLYVGGVPPSLAPGTGGFIGCVKDLTLNDAPAGSPTHSQGTVPCFQNPLYPGAYFSGQGGHIAIDESLVLGRDLEIQLDVRPVSDSGLLLHAGTSPDLHLSLVLSQGEVTVSVNTGKGEFSTSFTPEEPLCNGRWHTITGEFTSTDRLQPLNLTVYLGGVPGEYTTLIHTSLFQSYSRGFIKATACSRSLASHHFSQILYVYMEISGSAEKRYYPLKITNGSRFGKGVQRAGSKAGQEEELGKFCTFSRPLN